MRTASNQTMAFTYRSSALTTADQWPHPSASSLSAILSGCLLGALLTPQVAAAAVLNINQTSSAGYASALYDVPGIKDDQNVNSTAA